MEHRAVPCAPSGYFVRCVYSAEWNSAGRTDYKSVFRFWLYALSEMRQDCPVTAFDLRHEDCVAGMQTLPANIVDLVVTSPPYNLGIRYSKFSDRADRAGYLYWCKTWATEIARLLKADGSFFLNVGASPANPMFPHQIVLELRDLFVLQNTIHWIKSISIKKKNGKTVSHGHFKPVSSKRYLNDCHEYIFHFTKNGRVEIDRLAIGVPYQDKTNISRWSHTRGSDLRCRGNTWFIPYETIQSRAKERPHPATFPVRLAEWCIKLHGASRVETMLDPFLGIGNSAVAAQKCGVRKFIGFEIDETYLAEAKRRIERNHAIASET
jgi:site-specific DNA-methyltransferase (adenine-specific)